MSVCYVCFYIFIHKSKPNSAMWRWDILVNYCMYSSSHLITWASIIPFLVIWCCKWWLFLMWVLWWVVVVEEEEVVMQYVQCNLPQSQSAYQRSTGESESFLRLTTVLCQHRSKTWTFLISITPLHSKYWFDISRPVTVTLTMLLIIILLVLGSSVEGNWHY